MSAQHQPADAAMATGLATTGPPTAGRFESGAPVRGHQRGHIRRGHDEPGHDLHHDFRGHAALGHHHPAIAVRKDSPTMTATAHRRCPSPAVNVTSRALSAGEPVSRWRVSGWVMARVLLLLAVQISMIVALLTDHPGATTLTASAGPDVATMAAVSRAAFTRPLAPTAAAMAPLPSSSGSVSCAGHSLRGDGADAAGYNLNIALGGNRDRDRGWSGSGPGPLVVTCGQQGRLVILACAPLDQDSRRESGRGSGRDPASWNRPLTGSGASWWGAWRGDWRDQGFGPSASDDQLRLLNQLDPDQLRALLGQRALTTYPGSSYGRYGGGLGAGLVVGGMRISVGAPVSYGQLPSAGTWGSTGNPTPGYDSYGYGPGYSSGASRYGDAGSGNGIGYGPSYGPSGWNDAGDPDEPGSPILISHHHGSDSHADDDSDDDHPDGGGDGDRGGDRDWRGSSSGTAGPVAVCRSIGQR